MLLFCGGAPRRRPSCWLFVAERLWGSLVPSQRAPACSRAAFARVNQASRAPFRTALGFGLTTCKLVKACCARHPSSRGVAARPGSIEGEKPTIMGLPIGAALWAAF